MAQLQLACEALCMSQPSTCVRGSLQQDPAVLLLRHVLGTRSICWSQASIEDDAALAGVDLRLANSGAVVLASSFRRRPPGYLGQSRFDITVSDARAGGPFWKITI